jgi:hypothetical protein
VIYRDQTDAFMKKHSLYRENKTTAKIMHLLRSATGDVRQESKRLTLLLSFHIQKVQLVATTLQMLVGSGITRASPRSADVLGYAENFKPI